MRALPLFTLLALAGSAVSQPQLLYDNGPLITHPGRGANGADVSALENTAPMNLTVFGFGAQKTGTTIDNSMADDFTVCGTWAVTDVELYVYQTGSGTTSSINGVFLQIWNNDPRLPTSRVIAGNIATNLLTASSSNGFSNIYRTLVGSLTATDRPIMRVRVSVGASPIMLTPGVYWLQYQFSGGLASGPWVPPVTELGVQVTGDGLQRIGIPAPGVWQNAVSGAAPGHGQALPFKLLGSAQGQVKASAVTYDAGKSGANGVPTWNSSDPIIGRYVTFAVSNGVSGATPLVLIGLSRANIVLPPVGTLLVNPVGSFALPNFDSSNRSSGRFKIPIGPHNCGVTIDLQEAHLDNAAAGGVAHTGGLEWVLGN